MVVVMLSEKSVFQLSMFPLMTCHCHFMTCYSKCITNLSFQASYIKLSLSEFRGWKFYSNLEHVSDNVDCAGLDVPAVTDI